MVVGQRNSRVESVETLPAISTSSIRGARSEELDPRSSIRGARSHEFDQRNSRVEPVETLQAISTSAIRGLVEPVEI
jgi:hypothetical protein